MFPSIYSRVLLISSLFCSTVYAVPVPETSAVSTTPKVVFLLAGDSTTAPRGGWGDGFKNYTMSDKSVAYNYGHSGASTGSFIAGGDWTKVLNQTSYFARQNATVYVTIQFGHNDMKIANYSEIYRKNLVKMVGDVKKNAGVPIIVSSLSRRNYFNSTPARVDDTLRPWAQIALDVAQNTTSYSIDLWLNSLIYLNRIGPDAAHRLNLVPTDNTHLNNNGSILFGRLVSDLIRFKYTNETRGVFRGNSTLSTQLHNGIPSF